MAPSPEVLSSKNSDHVSQTCKDYSITPAQFEELRKRSVEAKSVAYCPYSNFRVGCALLTADDSIVTGANIENASYPVGTCAERVTIGKAVTEGHRGKFKVVAVATDISPPASPCGMCRQFIREFCDLTMPILMFDQNLDYVVLRLEDLLPLSFGPEHLQVERGS
ncbi:Cytidine deaminase [Coniochaeta hoffmannii]|uniref:Cytidine deaminase n=1 Tax=Coniochaeta hoffmannii TaxID=91930 RepID=A0AA38SD04_9PEZI|nr:Cytidine deaminase [Coniochaeta hoffmannii]